MSAEIDPHYGVSRKALSRSRQIFVWGLMFGLVLVAFAIYTKVKKQEGMLNIPPARHYSALEYVTGV